MIRPPLLAALLLALAACGGGETEQPAAPPPSTAAVAKPAAPAKPAPEVRSAGSYRCDDGTTIHVTFLADDRTAEVRRVAGEPPMSILKAESAGGSAFLGLGSRIDGTGKSISYVGLNQERQACTRVARG